MLKTLIVLSATVSMWMTQLEAVQARTGTEAAIELFDARRYEDAKEGLQRLLRADADNVQAQYYLGRTYFELCDYDGAVRHCKRAAELQDDNADYQFCAGRSYGAQAKRANPLEQAVLAAKIRRAFERAVELDPQHVQARYGLGNFYLQALAIMGGDLDKAPAQARALAQLRALVRSAAAGGHI